jgi:uncharacterized repeat protein (TIGR01451 family)
LSSRRIFLVAILVYGLIIASLWTVNNGPLLLAIPLVVYLGYVVIFHPGKLNLDISRELSKDFINSGEEVTVSITIKNQGDDLDEVRFNDILPNGINLVNGETTAFTSIKHDGSFLFEYTVTALRGNYTIDEIQVRATDHFGMYTQRLHLNIPQTLTILPDYEKIRSAQIRPLRTRGYAGPIPSRQAGSGTAFYGVRDYHSGDPRQWINWRISARQEDRLFSNEFEQERIADVGIILDARTRTNVTLASGSIFDAAVKATASLAEMFLADGNRVALIIYGRGLERTYPGYGKLQRENILRALANAKVGDSMVFESFDYLPTRFFPAKSQIVLVSTLCEEDPKVLSRIKAHGYKILVVSPDPVSFEKNRLPPSNAVEIGARIALTRRVLWIRYLQRVGIPVVNWQTDKSLDIAIQATSRRLGRGYL